MSTLHDFIQRRKWCLCRRFLLTPEGMKESTERRYFGNLPLHNAISKGAPLDLIRALLSNNPNAAKTCNSYDRLPLHFACSYGAPVEVVQVLLDQYIEAAKEIDKNGMLPLHYSCFDNSSLAVVQALLSAYPKGVKTADNNGLIPLHYTSSETPINIVEALLNAYPHGARIADNDGFLPLHYPHHSKTVETLLSIYPEGTNVANDHGELPLHRACLNCISKDTSTIEALLASHPTSVEMCDKYGRTPLHYACRYSNNPEVVQLLLKSAPHLAFIPDKVGALPIQCIWMDNETSSWRYGDYRCESKRWNLAVTLAYFMHCRIVGEDGMEEPSAAEASRFIMHSLATISCHVPSELWNSALRRLRKEDISRTDHQGRTPLHYAASCTCCSIAKTETFCKASKIYFDASTKSNSNIFHEATLSPASIILDLLILAPEAANVCDCNGQVPLVLALNNSHHVFQWHAESTHDIQVRFVQGDPSTNNLLEENMREMRKEHKGVMQALTTLSLPRLNVPDGVTGLLPFMLGSLPIHHEKEIYEEKQREASDLERLGTVYELLREHPVI